MWTPALATNTDRKGPEGPTGQGRVVEAGAPKAAAEVPSHKGPSFSRKLLLPPLLRRVPWKTAQQCEGSRITWSGELLFQSRQEKWSVEPGEREGEFGGIF